MKPIYFTLLLSACGQAPQITVEPAFDMYIAKFRTHVGVDIVDLSTTFATLVRPMVGECIHKEDGTREIKIDLTYWNNSSDDAREELLYHELGHCVLNKGHTSVMNTDGCPHSIMHPQVFGNSGCFINNKEYYFNELRE